MGYSERLNPIVIATREAALGPERRNRKHFPKALP